MVDFFSRRGLSNVSIYPRRDVVFCLLSPEGFDFIRGTVLGGEDLCPTMIFTLFI